MKCEGGAEVLNVVEFMAEAMREKERELEDLEALNQTLIVRERKRNDELQDARKELVNVSCLMPIHFPLHFAHLNFSVSDNPKIYIMGEGHSCFFFRSLLTFYCSSRTSMICP